MQRKNQRRTGNNFEKIKTNNHKTDNTVEKGRRTRTPPSLGFWPKLVFATMVPRSLQLQGSTGVSMGRTGLQVHRPKSWDPPMKKAPRSKRKKILHPTG